MTIKFLSFSYFHLLFFCSYAFIVSVAIDPGDYVFVDPKNAKIKVNDLRALLDKRGVPYHNFNEKSEYVNALVESGPLTVGELKIARNLTSGSISSDDIEELVTNLLSTTFSETAFSNSEIWLVRIDPAINPMANILEEAVWHRLKLALNTFEVQFGRYNCKNAADYCQMKKWNSPTLVLIVPQLHNSAKASAKAVAYLLQASKNSDDQWVYEVDSVVKQVYSVLHGKLVRYLPSREDFNHFQTDKLKCSVHMVLLTDLRHCPFLLSALAAKFNHGSHCFAFGPKAIASDDMVLPDNHVGAFYAVKFKFSHYYYSSRWRIIPQNQSTTAATDGMSNAMVTFESLSDLLQKLSPIEAKKPKATKKEWPKEGKKASPPPVYTSRKGWSGFSADLIAILICIGVELLVFITFLACVYYQCSERTERRREEEWTRYRSNITSRDRSDPHSFRRDILQEEAIDMNTNQEISLLSIEDYLTVMSLRVTNLTDWYKKVFTRYSLHRAVSRNMQMLLAHYNIRIEEIGFPPYNWILSLPAVETYNLSEDMRQSECLICQCSIDNSEVRLCRLPCNCRDVIYHFDCITPWLIKREDPNSHSFISGRLHTERPCPTCRYDITNWGLQQHLHND